MRRIGIALVLFLLGCGGLFSSGPTLEEELQAVSVPLTAPWTTMNLPIADGGVIASDPTMLTVTYVSADGAALASSWRAALEAHGEWKLERDTSGEGIHNFIYVRDGSHLVLNVFVTPPDIATVSLIVNR